MPPGYPLWRKYFLSSALLPVTRSPDALTTTMKSPVSTCGVYSGLCLPRKRSAICDARRPSTLFCASITYQSCWTSCAFAVYVFIARCLFRKAVDCKDKSTALSILGGPHSFGDRQKKSATLGGVALNPPKEEGGGDNLRMLPEASNLDLLCQRYCALQKYIINAGINIVYGLFHLQQAV